MQENFVFDRNGKKSFLPHMFALKRHVNTIFSVPGENRVATLELSNGLTFIEFKEQKLIYQRIIKNYYDEVYGDYVYSFAPVYSEDEILYGQNSWLFKIDINNKHVQEYELLGSIIEHMGQDFYRLHRFGTQHEFICEIRTPERKVLKVVELSDKATEKGKLEAGISTLSYDQPWQTVNNTIFTYDRITNKMQCHDSNLTIVTHPMVEIFNRNNATFRKLKEFIIHPTLPFGLLVEIGKDIDWNYFESLPMTMERCRMTDSLLAQISIHALYLVRWDTDNEKEQMIPIITEQTTMFSGFNPKVYSGFQLSPDGNWIVFRDETQYSNWIEDTPTAEKNPCFVAFRVNSKQPFFIGEPLNLGKVMREDAIPESSAWIQKPLSFVVSDGLMLYKWELETFEKTIPIHTR